MLCPSHALPSTSTHPPQRRPLSPVQQGDRLKVARGSLYSRCAAFLGPEGVLGCANPQLLNFWMGKSVSRGQRGPQPWARLLNG